MMKITKLIFNKICVTGSTLVFFQIFYIRHLRYCSRPTSSHFNSGVGHCSISISTSGQNGQLVCPGHNFPDFGGTFANWHQGLCSRNILICQLYLLTRGYSHGLLPSRLLAIDFDTLSIFMMFL